MKILSIALGVALAVASSSTFANSIQIMPVHIHADSSVRTGAIQLKNPGDQPVIYQATVYQRSQSGGEDVRTPTNDVLVSPVMIKLGAGEQKALRFMRVNADPSKSSYYWLVLQEVPIPDSTKVSDSSGTTIKTVYLFKQNLPMGFESKSAKPAHLVASMRDGKLLISNDGGLAWVMDSMGEAGQKPWKHGALGWILPGGGLSYDMPVHVGESIEVGDDKSKQTLVVQ